MSGSSNVGSRSRLPVTVLTGFLGSGKTTLLSKLVKHPDVANTAVVVNELGEIGLDHFLVTAGDEDVVLLDSGCLCCTISNTLGDTLGDLFFRRVRAEVPAFERVIIETTGLADPAPILHTLMTDGFVTRHYRLDGVVATVDGVHGLGQLEQHREALKQAAVADRILITKADLVTADRVQALRERLRGLNPAAPILEAIHGAVEPSQIFDVGLFDGNGKSMDVGRWLQAEAYADGHEEHGRNVNRHDEGIRASCLYFDFPVSWAGYAAWIARLRTFEGENLLRVKGLMRLGDREAPYVVQAVQHVFGEPIRLTDWPSEDTRSRLVFITRDMDRSIIEASRDALRGAHGTRRPAASRAVAAQ